MKPRRIARVFRLRRIKDIRKIRLKGEETGLEREGITFDYAYTALNRNLKGNRFGASIGSNAFLGESVFSKRGRGRILSPSSSSSSPPLRSTALLPLAKLDFLSGFHDLKARGEIEGFPVSPREHRNDTSIRKKGSVVVRFHPPSPSLSLASSDRSFHPSPWFCTFVRVHANFRSTKFTRTRGTRGPMGIGRRISSIPRPRLLSREEKSLLIPTEWRTRDIFPEPKFPSLRIYHRDLDKLATWTLFRQGFLSPRLKLASRQIPFDRDPTWVWNISAAQGGRVFVFGHRFFSRKGGWNSSLPLLAHLTGLNRNWISSKRDVLFLGYNLAYQFEYLGKSSPPRLLPRYLRCFPCKSNFNLWQPWRITG